MLMRCFPWLALAGLAISAQAQEIPTPQRAPAQGSANGLQLAEPVAVAGSPLGVLRVEVPLPPQNNPNPKNAWSTAPRILVEDTQDRVFYPVVSVRTIEVTDQPPPARIGRPGGLLDRVRSAIRGEPETRQVPVAITVMALFQGTEPIDLNLVGDVTQQIHFQPSVPAAGVTSPQLLQQWWDAYTRSAKEALAGDDFPKLLHKYLTSMLSRRLGLPQVDLDPPDPEDEKLSQPLETLALLSAIEPMREDILEDMLMSPSDPSEANLPVPPEPAWEQATLPPLAADVPVEELSQRVPPECFYLRFGAFTNYVWFQDIAERYGGDMAQAVTLRGLTYEPSKRMERMLASKLTTIARMFGDKLIGDMAVIGSDLYMQEGASLGILFQATNPALFTAAIETDRKAAFAKNPDATQTEVTIAGRSVSLLSTPDNRIRAFFVQDGPYIFVTTSRTLVQRFFEVADGAPSLADSRSFQWARTWMPLTNDYAVFAFFSPEFFHRLVSPQYQIELRRRLAAIANIEIAEVAQQVARAEGLPQDDVAALQQSGLLPPWFEQRADGGRTLQSKAGWIDSLRGARGSFLPIADVPLQAVSPREAAGYAQVADFYRQQWRHMDPLLFGLRRFQAEQGGQRELVAVEAYIAPFEPDKYGWVAQLLGQPTPIELQLPADDLISAQAHLRGQRTLVDFEDYHLFGGIKDMIPPDFENTDGLLRTLQALKSMPAYIGGWPKPGIMEQLPLGIGRVPPDAYGFSRLIGGLWRWQSQEFSLLSFDRSIIENAIPQLQPVATEDLAQARLRVADLSGSQLAHWINTQWYQRGWRSSQGNARLLDTVHQQLKVAAPQCLGVAEQLLDARLQCPLGGEYQFLPLPAGEHSGWWESTAWAATSWDDRGRPTPPPAYSAPWIDWFRGGRVHVTQGPSSLSLVGQIELEMEPLSVDVTPTLPSLPTMNFDLFGLPKKLFGGSPAPAAEKPPVQKF